MHIRTSLLASAAVGVLLAVSVSAAAEAKTVKHHKAHADGGESLTREQLEGLGAEVEDLKARLEAESDARARDEVAMKAAQDEAADAHAEAQAAHQQVEAQIQTIPGEVKSAVAANKPKPGWADNTTISGRVYANLSNISQSPSPNKLNGTGFDIKRAYLGVDHKFNDTYSASLLIDFAPGASAFTTPGTLVGAEVVKNAYIQAKYDPAFIVQLGAANMPWIPFVEDLYGQRYVEKTLTDNNKVGNSADWGAFVHGDFMGGLFGYAFAAVDGAGYKTPDRSKGLDFEGRVNVKYQGFVAAIGGYTGKEGLDVQQLVPATFHTATRLDAVVAYANPLFHVGLEYFNATNWKQVAKVAKDEQDGYSAFGTVNFYPKWSVFGRYDWGKPSKNLASAENLTYYNIGLQYEPVKVLDLGLVYKHDEVTHAPAGGYTDGTAALIPTSAGHGAKYDEVGLFTQVRF
jgi:hypothetical protein